MWVAGKTVWSLVNTCQPERFRGEYRIHYKALYICPVYLLYFCWNENVWRCRVLKRVQVGRVGAGLCSAWCSSILSDGWTRDGGILLLVLCWQKTDSWRSVLFTCSCAIYCSRAEFFYRLSQLFRLDSVVVIPQQVCVTSAAALYRVADV